MQLILKQSIIKEHQFLLHLYMAQLDMFGGNGNDNTFPKTGLNKITNGEFIYLPNFFSKFEMIFSIA